MTKTFANLLKASFYLCLLILMQDVSSPRVLAQTGFTRQVIITPQTPGTCGFENPTTMLIQGNRLFVGQQNGKIHIFTLDAKLNVTAVKCIDTIYNYGPPNPRLLTGMTFGPYFAVDSTDSIGPDLYVSHSDGHFYDPSIDPNSGTVTKLLAPNYQTGVDIVKGLPRSKGDHAPNGLVLGPDGFLYLAIGGNTNAGLPSDFFLNWPEVPKGAAILKIDYSGAVSTYATGFRNPYDMVWHTNGQLYVNDNGANAGFGNAPDPTTCGAPGYDPGDQPDELNRIEVNRYYGHPNPSRGECIFNGGQNYFPPIYTYGLHTSSDGITEYTDSLIPGFQGNLFTANWASGDVIRLQLSADGKTVKSGGVFASGFGNPIDVVVNSDTFFIAEHGPHQVTVLRWIHTH
ncbi:MAG TPA: PQQ-dependent sugar dehydrogenase [Pyrinomonadaceae bacterium]|nr:PQQ-dependent sugar dehydrogenase [Pyrinomonadaceae bacterium]